MKIVMTLLFLMTAGICFAGSAFNDGMRYYSAKKYDQAREALLREVSTNNSNGTAYYFLGEVEKNTGNFADAENYYRKAVEAQIQRKYLSLAYWNIIVLVEQRNDIPALIKICREFNQRTGDGSAKRKVDDIINKLLWTDNETAVTLYKEGTNLKSAGKTEAARQKFIEALQADSSFLAPHFEIGLILYNNGKATEAAQHFKTIADRIPYYSSVNLLLGDIYYDSKSYSAAAEAFSNSLEYGFIDKDTQYNLFVKLSGCYYNMREYAKSAEYANMALAINPKDRDTLMLLSAINIKRENYDDALSALTKLDAITPDDPEIIYQIGSIYYKKGNKEKYSAFFSRLFTLVSQDGKTPSKFQKAMIILYKYEEENKSYERAVTIAESLPENARDFSMNLSLAKCYAQTKKIGNAIQILERLSLPNDEKLYLCKLYLRDGQRPKAKNTLSSLILYNMTLRDKALADRDLSPLAKEIIDENKPKPKPIDTTPKADPNNKDKTGAESKKTDDTAAE
jgi:tetratricopeptide (TPR) repeat protein